MFGSFDSPEQEGDTLRGARKARTYLPDADADADAREEILDFAELMRELEIFRILGQVTNARAAGESITIVPQGATLTTQQAADSLGIGRPTLVRLLGAGDVAHDKPGRHRRVRREDRIAYRASFRAALRALQHTSFGTKIQVGDPAEVKRHRELNAA